MNKGMPYWFAFVIHTVRGRFGSSFLTFWARNRFEAMKAIEGMLSQKTELLDDKGQIPEYTIFTLRQCKQEEVDEYMRICQESFLETVEIMRREREEREEQGIRG